MPGARGGLETAWLAESRFISIVTTVESEEMQQGSRRLTKRAFLEYVRIAARRAVEETLADAADRFASGTSAGLQRIGDRLDSVDQQVGTLREYAGRSQAEIDRLREGYDWTIHKRFAQRLIHTVDSLSSRIEHHGAESEVGQALEVVRLELLFLLESNDIVEWSPDEGRPVRERLDRCEVIGTRPTPAGGTEGQILEVARPAFLVDPPEGSPRVLRAAQVVVAKNEQE